jgi:hypothetical protein
MFPLGTSARIRGVLTLQLESEALTHPMGEHERGRAAVTVDQISLQMDFSTPPAYKHGKE